MSSEASPDLRHLPADYESLRQECRQQREQIEVLRAELAETNQGVVALYAELDDQAETLRQATALKSRFLSYMSHEFRTPLSSIRSLARLLLDEMDGPLNSEQRKQVQFVENSAVELTEMTDDLLDLAKIEAGKISISPEWFEMVDLFSALRGMFKPLIAPLTVSLILEEPENMPALYTDNKKLSQILRNFISNALKFTPHGEVRVSAGKVGEDRVKFSVVDTGIGIPPEHLPRIFQDFVQVDSSLQRKLHGTGLGLSLSKKIAELLGGSVEVESEQNVGSTFSVVIPIHHPEHRDPTGLKPGSGDTESQIHV